MKTIKTINTVETLILWALILMLTPIIYLIISRNITSLMGIELYVRLEGDVEWTAKWLNNHIHNDWRIVQPSDLSELSPFLLSNDWEFAIINQLEKIDPNSFKGFRVGSEHNLRLMSYSVEAKEIAKKNWFQLYNECVLSSFPIYNPELGTSFTLEQVWPENGLRLPFKKCITRFDQEVEPNIINKIRCYRSEDLSLRQNLDLIKQNKFHSFKFSWFFKTR